MRATCFFISLSKEQLQVVFILFVRNLHLNTHTIMSTKLMDATPDLKRLAPVENLAIDVISYAHGSVTPTLTNLYTKGKDSFLKVSKSSSSCSWCLSLSLFLLLSFFFVFKLSVMVSIISMLLRFVFTAVVLLLSFFFVFKLSVMVSIISMLLRFVFTAVVDFFFFFFFFERQQARVCCEFFFWCV